MRSSSRDSGRERVRKGIVTVTLQTNVFRTIRSRLDSDILAGVVHVVTVGPTCQEVASVIEVDTVDVCIVYVKLNIRHDP